MKPLIDEYVKDSRKIHNNTVDDITNKNLDLLCYRLNQLALVSMMAEALAKKVGVNKAKVI